MNPGILTPPTQFATMPRGLLGRPTPVPMVDYRTPTPLDPRSIAGLAVWFDASDRDSVTLNGQNVAEWRDKSGNGKHMSQSTAANQPAYAPAAQNGNSAIRPSGFPVHLRRESGGSVLQESMSYLGQTTHTIIWAIKANASSSGNYLAWAINPSATASRLQVTGPLSVAPTNYVIDSGNFTAGRLFGPSLNSPTPAVPATAAHIGIFRRDAASFSSFVNGATSESATRASAVAVNYTGTFTLFGWVNAAGSAQDSSGFAGDVFEIMYFNRALTTDERRRIEAYLGAKWGIAVA